MNPDFVLYMGEWMLWDFFESIAPLTILCPDVFIPEFKAKVMTAEEMANNQRLNYNE